MFALFARQQVTEHRSRVGQEMLSALSLYSERSGDFSEAVSHVAVHLEPNPGFPEARSSLRHPAPPASRLLAQVQCLHDTAKSPEYYSETPCGIQGKITGLPNSIFHRFAHLPVAAKRRCTQGPGGCFSNPLPLGVTSPNRPPVCVSRDRDPTQSPQGVHFYAILQTLTASVCAEHRNSACHELRAVRGLEIVLLMLASRHRRRAMDARSS